MIDTWTSTTTNIVHKNSYVNFTKEDNYIWINFLYSPNGREFKQLIAYFLYNHGKDAIIEFKTNKPLLFKNHSVYIGDGIYRWITWAEVENHQHKEQND